MKKPKNKAKPLKLGKNDIICPSCSSVLNISKELKTAELIQCPKCEIAIKNPLFVDKSANFNIDNYSDIDSALKNIIEKNGYLVISINDYYVQFAHFPNEQELDCEAVSHHYIPEVGDLTNEFQTLSYKIEQSSNYYKRLDLNTITTEIIIQEIERIFVEIYKIEFVNYQITLEIDAYADSNATSESKNLNTKNNVLPNDKDAVSEEPISLTKKQKNWFVGIIIFVIILIVLFAGILYEPGGIHTNVKKPVIGKHEIKRSPEIIYTEIRKALTDEFPGTCKILFNEMQTDYPNSILFDSVKIIYDSAMSIVQLKKEEARKKRKIYEANKKKETKQVKQSKFLKVFAQAYSDGILSCNVYLTDKSGNIHYLNANSISYSIYDFHNNRIKPIGNISKSNTNAGLYIDIPLGTNIFNAKSISFVVKTTNGVTYKSNSVSIDY